MDEPNGRTSSGPALDRYLGGSSRTRGIVVAMLFIAVVGFVDWRLGSSVSLAPFYLMPVIWVTWNVGRAWGIAMAGLAVIATRLSDGAEASFDSWSAVAFVQSWNAVVWFVVLAFIIWMLTALRSTVRTQRKQIAEEAEVSDDLRAQNAMQNTLLHAVSHDLKGPLAGVLGAIQTIRRAEQLKLRDKEMQELYDVIEQAGKKAARLVDDLLDLDRLDRGQLTPEREGTDIVALAERLAEELPTLEGHPVRVDGDRVLANVDAAKVERIIENLLNNSARHTPAGTPIHVEVRRSKDGVVVIEEDEGPGVPSDIRTAIFEPFHQGENARGGVGIGLSLVQRFAQLHGGSAHVEDRPGGGARFVVTLPCEVEELPKSELRAV